MSDFAPLVSRWAIVNDWLAEIRAWMPEYLAAFERQAGIGVGRTGREISYVARHAGLTRPGERVPAIVAWPIRVTDKVYDPDSGTIGGTLLLGLLVVGGAADLDSTGDVLHRLVAAVCGLLDNRTTVAGHASDLEVVDEDFEGVVETGQEQRLVAAGFVCAATGVIVGHRHIGPPGGAGPRTDPSPPWPPDPVAEAAYIDLAPERIYDPED